MQNGKQSKQSWTGGTFRAKEREEQVKMWQIMEEPDRMERWKKMAAAFHTGADWLRRRPSEVM